MKAKQQDLSIPEVSESRERRERPFEIRLTEEIEYLRNNDQTDYLIFKMIPNNVLVNPKLKNALKRKAKRGTYTPIAPTVKVIRLYETGTTADYLMRLVSRGGELVHSEISDKAKQEAGKDTRLQSLLLWISNMGKLQTIKTPAQDDEALEKKLRAKLEAQIRQEIANESKVANDKN